MLLPWHCLCLSLCATSHATHCWQKLHVAGWCVPPLFGAQLLSFRNSLFKHVTAFWRIALTFWHIALTLHFVMRGLQHCTACVQCVSSHQPTCAVVHVACLYVLQETHCSACLTSASSRM